MKTRPMAILITMSLAVLLAASADGAKIHVATNGAVANPGTVGKPVATLQAAQQLVRSHATKGLREPVTVIIRRDQLSCLCEGRSQRPPAISANTK